MTEEREQESWPEAIGTYITSFAYVELLVYELFELLPQDTVVSSHSGLRDFSERVRLLQALIRSSAWHDKADIENLLEALMAHATLRNQIAHNPLFIDIFVDGENVVTSGRLIHTKKRKPLNHINLATLHNKQNELNALSEKLAFHVGFIKGCRDRRDEKGNGA